MRAAAEPGGRRVSGQSSSGSPSSTGGVIAPGCHQFVELAQPPVTAVGRGNQLADNPPVGGDYDSLSRLDSPNVPAEVVSQFPYAGLHVPIVATRPQVQTADDVVPPPGFNSLCSVREQTQPRPSLPSLRFLHLLSSPGYRRDGMSTEKRARLSEIVSVDPGLMHGAPCFRGTRGPVRLLLDDLKSGFTIDEFLAGGARPSLGNWLRDTWSWRKIW